MCVFGRGLRIQVTDEVLTQRQMEEKDGEAAALSLG